MKVAVTMMHLFDFEYPLDTGDRTHLLAERRSSLLPRTTSCLRDVYSVCILIYYVNSIDEQALLCYVQGNARGAS